MKQSEIAEAGACVMQATAMITTAGCNALVKAKELRREAAVSLATQATIGCANVLASLIGPPAEGEPQLGGGTVNNDTLLLALCLVSVSVNVSSRCESAHIVTAVDFDQSPACYQSAMDMFEKITGRSAASVARPAFADAAKRGSKEAQDLLSKVCANNKPA